MGSQFKICYCWHIYMLDSQSNQFMFDTKLRDVVEADWKKLAARVFVFYYCFYFRVYRRRARFHRAFSKSSFRGELMAGAMFRWPTFLSMDPLDSTRESWHEGAILLGLLLRLASNISQYSHQISFLREPVFRGCGIVDDSFSQSN